VDVEAKDKERAVVEVKRAVEGAAAGAEAGARRTSTRAGYGEPVRIGGRCVGGWLVA
jgi:hypothetical protein